MTGLHRHASQPTTRVGVHHIEVISVRGLPGRYDRIPQQVLTFAAAQRVLDIIAPEAGKRVHPRVEVVVLWKDGTRHRTFYRLDNDVCLRDKVQRYFMLYAGIGGKLTETEKDEILPPHLRQRYHDLLQTHQLS